MHTHSDSSLRILETEPIPGALSYLSPNPIITVTNKNHVCCYSLEYMVDIDPCNKTLHYYFECIDYIGYCKMTYNSHNDCYMPAHLRKLR